MCNLKINGTKAICKRPVYLFLEVTLLNHQCLHHESLYRNVIFKFGFWLTRHNSVLTIVYILYFKSY